MKEHHISDCSFENIRPYSMAVNSYGDVYKTKVFRYISRGQTNISRRIAVRELEP